MIYSWKNLVHIERRLLTAIPKSLEHHNEKKKYIRLDLQVLITHKDNTWWKNWECNCWDKCWNRLKRLLHIPVNDLWLKSVRNEKCLIIMTETVST